MDTSEWIAVIANLLTVLSLMFVVKQLLSQAKSNAMAALESSYSRFLDIDSLCVEHPELQLATVRPEVLQVIEGFDCTELKKRAYIEYLLDLHELMFFRHKTELYSHQADYLDTVVSNPHVLDYWQRMRGNFRAEFVQAMDQAISRVSNVGATA